MKTAEEMFKELGFCKIGDIVGCTMYSGGGEEITFNDNYISYYAKNSDNYFYANVKLHKAINQQLKELEWL